MEQLNAVVASPTLTKGNWQQRLQDWRYSLNNKHRKHVLEANITGGGQSSLKPLKDYEKRALQLFNPITNTGNTDLLIEGGITEEFIVPREFIIEETVDEPIEELIEDSVCGGVSESVPVPLTRSNATIRPSRVTVGARANSERPHEATEPIGLRRAASERLPTTSKRKQRRHGPYTLPTSRTSDDKFEKLLQKMDEMENRRLEYEKQEREETRSTIVASVHSFSSAINNLANAIASSMNNK